MGMVPPPILKPRRRQPEAQPKTDHPMAEELEEIRQRAEEQGLTHIGMALLLTLQLASVKEMEGKEEQYRRWLRVARFGSRDSFEDWYAMGGRIRE